MTASINFTVGQRKGLGLGDLNENGEPLYVVRLEPETRRVFVGPQAALAKASVTLREVNWLGRAGEPTEKVAVEVKLRSMTEPKPAIVIAAARRPCARRAHGAAVRRRAGPGLRVLPGQPRARRRLDRAGTETAQAA